VLPTFVIGLREGLEAALIVGIIAAFLAKHGRRAALRQVWAGTGLAVLICLGIAIALQVISADLPQRQQEGLETVIGLAAVAMVTYMALFMRRNSRAMKGELEKAAAAAVATGSAAGLVAMAFLAVLREGVETSVFLLATFNASGDATASWSGALIGIVVAALLGYGIYRGGVRINMARFFRITGLVLVVVAAGLLMTAAHTASEAGWLTIGQAQALDLSWLVRPGTPVSSLVTGVLGIQPFPAQIEVAAYLVYLVPMILLIAIPPRRRPAPPAAAGAPAAEAPGASAAVAPVTTGTSDTPVSSAATDPASPTGHIISAAQDSSATAVPDASSGPGRSGPAASPGSPAARAGGPASRSGQAQERLA
jgi:high-affinity iron transporter